MYCFFYDLRQCTVGTSDFDAQMSAFLKCDENVIPVYKKPFYEILSGCLHFGS
jgi:hypothetical protein